LVTLSQLLTLFQAFHMPISADDGPMQRTRRSKQQFATAAMLSKGAKTQVLIL
jgi:hypothetical protein